MNWTKWFTNMSNPDTAYVTTTAEKVAHNDTFIKCFLENLAVILLEHCCELGDMQYLRNDFEYSTVHEAQQ